MNACVLLRRESIVATPDLLFKFNFAKGLAKVSLRDLVDGLYGKNKPSISPALILKINHQT